MIAGNPLTFAIESHITAAYANRGALALGYFVIYLGGVRYGVRKPDASWLACSFETVKERIAARGKHTASFAQHENGRALADAYRDAFYNPDPQSEYSFMNKEDFEGEVYCNDLLWAPDGDEAFDDRSYILQFDVGDRVRIIGFKSHEGYHSAPEDFADVWISADDYYGILREWTRRFEEEWRSLPKKQLEVDPKLSDKS